MKSWINAITALVLVVVAALLVVALWEKRGARDAALELGDVEALEADTLVAEPVLDDTPSADPIDASTGVAAAAEALEDASGIAGGASESPIQELRLPLEFYDNGALKSQLTAAFANVPETGAIDASDVRFEMFEPDGVTNLVVTAEECRFDRDAGLATSQTRVTLRKRDVAISGVGLEWELTNEVIRLRDDVKVVMQRTLKARGGFLGGEPTGD